MDETDVRPGEWGHCIVITRPRDAWRVTVVAPPRGQERQPPHSTDFADSGQALDHAADLAHRTGWSITDMTGRWSQRELKSAIRRAAVSSTFVVKWPDTAV